MFTLQYVRRCFAFLFFLQAVDSLVRATTVSDVESRATGLKNVHSTTDVASTPRPSCPQDRHTSESLKVKEKMPDNLANSLENEMDEEIGNGNEFKDIIQVRETDYEIGLADLKQRGIQASSGAVGVKGRLKAHIDFWINIQAPSFIIQTIREGYKYILSL